jgi:hypothetical protein
MREQHLEHQFIKDSFRRFIFPFPFLEASSSAGASGGAVSRIVMVPSGATWTAPAPLRLAAR